MKKAIVTGANGFLGKALINKLLEENVHVIALVTNICRNNNCMPPNLHYFVYDGNNSDKLNEIMDDEQADVMFHLAWKGSSGEQRMNYNVQISNVNMSLDYLLLAEKINCPKFISVGTIGEYILNDPRNEKIMTKNRLYLRCKKFTHNLMNDLSYELKCKVIWASLANIYGVGDNTNNLINYTVNSLLQGKRPSFGPAQQPYDFLYISDCVDALYLLGETNLHSNDFYVGSGKYRKLYEYILTINSLVANNVGVGIGEMPDDKIIYDEKIYDISRLSDETGYIPKISFEDGIIKLLNHE